MENPKCKPTQSIDGVLWSMSKNSNDNIIQPCIK